MGMRNSELGVQTLPVQDVWPVFESVRKMP